MKKTMSMLAVLLAVAPTLAMADIDVDSTSSSGSEVGIGINVINGHGGAGNGESKIKYGGDYTVRNVPGVVLGGFSNSFSADYCGGTAQAGVTVAGFGGSAGAPVFDTTCKILRAVEKTANLAQQALQVTPARAEKLMRAADLMMCQAVPGVTDVAFTKAGIDCGQEATEDPQAELRAEWNPKAFGQP